MTRRVFFGQKGLDYNGGVLVYDEGGVVTKQGDV